MVTCVQCGCGFQPVTTGARYCSKDCRSAALRRRIRVTCRVCGTRFETVPSRLSSARGKYCSRECSGRGRRATTTAKCAACGRVFTPKKRRQRYCSLSCSAAAQRVRIERTCAHCGQPFQEIPARIRNGRGKFCSQTCKYAARMLQITNACDHCGKVFTRDPSKSSRYNNSFCSFKCYAEHGRKLKTCITCGKQFVTTRCKDRSFCSYGCMGRAKWDRENRQCEVCHKSFWVATGQAAKGYGRYCSFRCFLQSRGVTNIEAAVAAELERRNIKFEREVKISRYHLDFLLPQWDAVIECDGAFWHSSDQARERDARKDKYLTERGLIVFRLTSTQIEESLTDCIDRIVNMLES